MNKEIDKAIKELPIQELIAAAYNGKSVREVRYAKINLKQAIESLLSDKDKENKALFENRERKVNELEDYVKVLDGQILKGKEIKDGLLERNAKLVEGIKNVISGNYDRKMSQTEYLQQAIESTTEHNSGICSECDGKGVFLPHHDPSGTEEIICDKCKGTGESKPGNREDKTK